MSVGKYSPTVSDAYYYSDQKWWEKNGGNPSLCGYDSDGYDLYGYDEAGRDRAGNTEGDYLTNVSDEFGDEIVYILYETVLEQWIFDKNIGKPKKGA